LLADDDHRAYAHAVEQLRAPDHDATLGSALRRAAEVPLQIAEVAADVAALAALAARDGAVSVRADACRGDARRGRSRGRARPRQPGDATRWRVLQPGRLGARRHRGARVALSCR
jgi:hypothetical protein